MCSILHIIFTPSSCGVEGPGGNCPKNSLFRLSVFYRPAGSHPRADRPGQRWRASSPLTRARSWYGQWPMASSMGNGETSKRRQRFCLEIETSQPSLHRTVLGPLSDQAACLQVGRFSSHSCIIHESRLFQWPRPDWRRVAASRLPGWAA
jgi:hypothetical protein